MRGRSYEDRKKRKKNGKRRDWKVGMKEKGKTALVRAIRKR